MAATASLRQIAAAKRVTYQTAARWAKDYGWQPVRRANRTLGICALYNYDHVCDSLEEERSKRAA